MRNALAPPRAINDDAFGRPTPPPRPPAPRVGGVSSATPHDRRHAVDDPADATFRPIDSGFGSFP